MKPAMSLMFCLLSAVCVHAAELQLELPQAEWLLPPVSPPLLQREGTQLATEREYVARLVALIGQQDNAGALAYIHQQLADLSGWLEAGDPDGRIRQRVSPGGSLQT